MVLNISVVDISTVTVGEAAQAHMEIAIANHSGSYIESILLAIANLIKKKLNHV